MKHRKSIQQQRIKRKNPQTGQKKRIDLTGQRFGRFVVKSFAFANASGKAMWLCICDCGVEKIVNGQNLLNHMSTNCGCQGGSYSHGRSRTPEYQAYYGAQQRCAKTEGYADRGILFKFTSFEEFFEEVGPRPGKGYSLDRIDNNGNYEKGNLRWATAWEQQHNTRRKHIEEFSDEIIIREVVRRKLIIPQAV